MDLGFVVPGSNIYTAYIYSDVNGALTKLFNEYYNGSVAANSTLNFVAQGSSLTLSLNGNVIGHATDTALASTAGSVGTWTSSGAVMSNFVAAPLTGAAPADLATVNFVAAPVTGAAPAAPATVNGTSNANEAVSVTINALTTGHGVKSVRRLREKREHAHRAELRRQSAHGQQHQRDHEERQRHHHSK